MNLQARRHGVLDLLQEAQELLVAMANAANSEVVPWRKESCVRRSTWPGPSGKIG